MLGVAYIVNPLLFQGESSEYFFQRLDHVGHPVSVFISTYYLRIQGGGLPHKKDGGCLSYLCELLRYFSAGVLSRKNMTGLEIMFCFRIGTPTRQDLGTS